MKRTSVQPGWFVGAYWEGEQFPDQTLRFIQQGIWINGYRDRFLNQVRSMRPGDPIALKKTYTRVKHLPFQNYDKYVSVMAITAIGTVQERSIDGRHVLVDWWKVHPKPPEWYFFTYQWTVWCVEGTTWMRRALLDFAFHGRRQDIQRFLAEPCWASKYRP